MMMPDNKNLRGLYERVSSMLIYSTEKTNDENDVKICLLYTSDAADE